MAVTVLLFLQFLLEIPFLWPKWPEKRPKLVFRVSAGNFASHYFGNRSIFFYTFFFLFFTNFVLIKKVFVQVPKKLMQSGQNCKKLKIGSFFLFFVLQGLKSPSVVPKIIFFHFFFELHFISHLEAKKLLVGGIPDIDPLPLRPAVTHLKYKPVI